MNANKTIEDEINQEEVFKEIKEFKADPNAIYVEYNPSLALEKLLNMKYATPAEQLSYAKHLAELIEIIDDEGVNKLGQILDEFTNEPDNIKSAVLTQITPLTSFLHFKKNNYKEILESVLPTLSKLLTSQNMQIKEDAGEEMGKIAYILNEEDRGKYILTTVLSMAHDDLNENNRIVAVQLLSKMASCFGKDLCEQFVGLEFLSLGEDPQIRVRKEAITNLSLLSKVVTHSFFKQRLLPFFINLTSDTAWVVRKACIDHLVDITKMCEPSDRETTLTFIMLRFLKDNNKWVKISSYKQLGPFISTLAGLNINEKLYENYCLMTDSTLNNLSPENEIIISCAFNFPAVLQAFGANRWPQMSKMFLTMMKRGAEIRRPLACSLHEIARIIGPDRAEKDLISILENILKDQNDEVKYGAIKNLSNFLTVFDTDKKENLIDVFLQLQKDPKKWRIRELIARQIDKLANIYQPETVFRIISPISFKLCNDPVSIVREKASKKIFAVLLKLIKEKEELYKTCVIENIKGFSLSSRFNQRQAFLFMAEKLLNYPEIFLPHIMSSFKNLVNDKVCNVRLTLAKVLSRHWKNNGKLKNNEEIIEIMKILRNDKSKDVKYFIENIQLDENGQFNGKIQPGSPKKEQLSPKKIIKINENQEKYEKNEIKTQENNVKDVSNDKKEKIEKNNEIVENLTENAQNNEKLEKDSSPEKIPINDEKNEVLEKKEEEITQKTENLEISDKEEKSEEKKEEDITEKMKLLEITENEKKPEEKNDEIDKNLEESNKDEKEKVLEEKEKVLEEKDKVSKEEENKT